MDGGARGDPPLAGAHTQRSLRQRPAHSLPSRHSAPHGASDMQVDPIKYESAASPQALPPASAAHALAQPLQARQKYSF